MKNFFLILFALILLNGCNSNQEKLENQDKNFITLTDTQGNHVTLLKPAQKVVCLFDPSVDVIYMLQKEETLVGIPAELYFDKELYNYFKLLDKRIEAKLLSTPGSNDLANIESIVALKPDLVIAKNLTASTIQTLKSMQIPVYLSSSDTNKNLIKEMRDISIMLGNEKRGEELIAYAKSKAKELQSKADLLSEGKRKTAYFSWANGRIFTTTGVESMMNNCLDLAGVNNVCSTKIDKMNVNPETLIQWNPDMIVMWNDSPNLFYEKPELASITAIKDKQVYNLMPMFFYSPHTFKALCAATAINNWAYTHDKNLELKDLKEIILKLYGEKNGTELMKYL
ncbi:ABC transporter substrate-binding protein [Apibacter muscae]|uniref:ABC transporter substrate-binding protein n=1 Tax=Apibacter muscae TaxID=2509004 RepID=UPI0011AC23AA|nr:ABC transporter substrate-binding protein [Apibacter muscae]TWP25221.1 ABC transporter substrate-binding protein [Apibacter muscae]